MVSFLIYFCLGVSCSLIPIMSLTPRRLVPRTFISYLFPPISFRTLSTSLSDLVPARPFVVTFHTAVSPAAGNPVLSIPVTSCFHSIFSCRCSSQSGHISHFSSQCCIARPFRASEYLLSCCYQLIHRLRAPLSYVYCIL